MPAIVLDPQTREGVRVAVLLALGYQWATYQGRIAVLLDPADLSHRLARGNGEWAEGRAEGSVVDLERQHQNMAPSVLDHTMYGAGTEELMDWLEKNRCAVRSERDPEEGNWRIMVSLRGTGTGVSPSFPLALCAAICGACGMALPEHRVYVQYIDLEGEIPTSGLTPKQQRLAAYLREQLPPPQLSEAHILEIVEAQPEGTPEAFEAQVAAAATRAGVTNPRAYVAHVWRNSRQLPTSGR